MRLLTGTRVRRVLTDQAGTRVVGLDAEGPDGQLRIGGDRFVLAAGAVNSAALLLASASERQPRGLANSSDQVGRNLMMHDNAHLAAVDVRHRNDVTFQKTLSVNDWYLDGGDGYPLGSMQLIGKVQGVMMKSWATRWPQAVLDQVAARSVECLVMAEDLPSADERVTVDAAGQDPDDSGAGSSSDASQAPCACQPSAAGCRLPAHRHAAVRHQHEQPPVRHRPMPAPTPRRASSTHGAAATTSPTSGSSMGASSRPPPR